MDFFLFWGGGGHLNSLVKYSVEINIKIKIKITSLATNSHNCSVDFHFKLILLSHFNLIIKNKKIRILRNIFLLVSIWY